MPPAMEEALFTTCKAAHVIGSHVTATPAASSFSSRNASVELPSENNSSTRINRRDGGGSADQVNAEGSADRSTNPGDGASLVVHTNAMTMSPGMIVRANSAR